MKDLGCQTVHEHSFSSEVTAELSRPSLTTFTLENESLLFACRGHGTSDPVLTDLHAARAEMPLKPVRFISFPKPPEYLLKSHAF